MEEPHAVGSETLHFLTHELKNAVIAISGFTKRLMRREQDPDRREQWKTREPIEIMANKNLLRVVYQNLLGNTVKYCDPGGAISFDVQGLKDEYQFNVWNEGTGLGLYSVRQIIEADKGRIWCETRPGKWINLVSTLPKRP